MTTEVSNSMYKVVYEGVLKKYSCSRCDKVLSSLYKLRRHVNSMHQCPHCPKSFSVKSLKVTHMKQEHKELVTKPKVSVVRVTCYICDKEFNSKKILTEHWKTHAEYDKEGGVTEDSSGDESEDKLKRLPHVKQEIILIKEELSKEDTLYLSERTERIRRRTLRSDVKVKKLKKEKPLPKPRRYKTVPSAENDKLSLEAKVQELADELYKHHQNIRTILQTTNATPFVIKSSARIYGCAYCSDAFETTTELKQHSLQHNFECKKTFMDDVFPSRYIVRLDITDLRCELCQIELDSLEQTIDHLSSTHKKELFTDIKSHIIPFKFYTNTAEFSCCICRSIFSTFKTLNVHMRSHFRYHVCNKCDCGFVNVFMLRNHIGNCRTRPGTFKCQHCPKEFKNERYVRNHERLVHVLKGKASKCRYCGERFSNYYESKRHIEKEHGVQRPVYNCSVCGKNFSTKIYLTHHTRMIHLMEREFECNQCDKMFYRKKYLHEHILSKHTVAMEFKCDLCPMVFNMKKWLTRHMKIHAKPPKHGCDECSEKFSLLRSLRLHVKTKHPHIKVIKRKLKTPKEHKIHKCEFCFKIFNKKNGLTKHMYVHSEPKFVCHFCSLRFKRGDKLKLHIRKAHTDVSLQSH